MPPPLTSRVLAALPACLLTVPGRAAWPASPWLASAPGETRAASARGRVDRQPNVSPGHTGSQQGVPHMPASIMLLIPLMMSQVSPIHFQTRKFPRWWSGSFLVGVSTRRLIPGTGVTEGNRTHPGPQTLGHFLVTHQHTAALAQSRPSSARIADH